MKDWKERVIRAVNEARMILRDEGRLSPTAFIFGDDFKIINRPWDTDEEKDKATALFRDEAVRLNATLFFFIEEGSATELGTGRQARVVEVYVQSSVGGEWSGLAFITEDKGYPTFGELDFAPMRERRVGQNRFGDLLPSKAKIPAVDDAVIQRMAEGLYQVLCQQGEARILDAGKFPAWATKTLQQELYNRILPMVEQRIGFMTRIFRPRATEKGVNEIVEKVRAAVLEIARKHGLR